MGNSRTPPKKPHCVFIQNSDTGVLVASLLMQRLRQIIQDSPMKQLKLTEIEIEHKLRTAIIQRLSCNVIGVWSRTNHNVLSRNSLLICYSKFNKITEV